MGESRMIVTLLAINSKYVHSSLAVWVISAGVKCFAASANAKIDVNILETTIHHDNSDIVAELVRRRPDVVGVSTYIWNAEKLPGLLRLLRESLPQAQFVLGGPEAAYNSEYWLANGADHVLCGKGEYELPEFLFKTALLESDKSECINPYSEEYFAELGSRLAYIETSRGCPFKCKFCLSGKECDSQVLCFPIETVKERILELSKTNAKTIKFVDRTFNCNSARAYEIFEYVISLDTTRKFHFEVAADLFDERTLTLLSKAQPGRIQFEAGLQSFYKPALEASSRKTDVEKAVENIKTILAAGNIHVHVDLIAGLPYETLGDFKGSFNKAFAIKANTLQLGFLKLIHGSKLREEADVYEIKYSETPPYEIVSNPWLSESDLKTLKCVEDALQHTYNKKRFLTSLDYVMNVSPELTPFDFFLELGNNVGAAHGVCLGEYAEKFYSYCAALPKVENEKLLDCMACDWLGMVRGNNKPSFLKRYDKNSCKLAKAFAEKALGRKIVRYEAAVLYSGEIALADSQNCDPVTGLYKVTVVDWRKGGL